MIIGNSEIFAIESEITEAYEKLSFRALGFFNLHVSGKRFGIHEPDASMLACSFHEVEDRISRRGSHIAPFATDASGKQIAEAFLGAIYAPQNEPKEFLGMTHSEFSDLIHSRHIAWAPDGDEAFDDGSFALHFDIKDSVRLICFKSTDFYLCAPGTMHEARLSADLFYKTLADWRNAFLQEWVALPKV